MPPIDLLSRLTRALRRVGLLKPATGRWTAGRFEHRHRPIDYRLFVPARSVRGRRPLLLMLHGCTQDPEDFAAGTRMNMLAAEHGVLVLYPTQTETENAARCWNWFLPQNQRRERGEAALLAALAQAMVDEHDADPARVYVAGLSAGGAMADILGRTHPELFAAVGVHSGVPHGAARDLFSGIAVMKSGPGAHHAPAGPMPPVIVFHGDADEIVHPRNGEQLVADALAGGGLRPAGETRGLSKGGRAFTRRSYADAHGRPRVEHWVVHGGGHAWAGGSAEGSFADPAGPDASAEMLRFFLAHPGQP
ncbi:PHB depolymerase family esterase [Variovorax defluvii]|uniref:PHB depolymerase family esterase n=1 Tax=Variovorax defluvii TaxID=913761 RepID=A0ABP8HC53_9BURK